MSTVMKKSFDNPDEVRAPDKAKVSVCDLGGIALQSLFFSQAGVGKHVSNQWLEEKVAKQNTLEQ